MKWRWVHENMAAELDFFFLPGILVLWAAKNLCHVPLLTESVFCTVMMHHTSKKYIGYLISRRSLKYGGFVV